MNSNIPNDADNKSKIPLIIAIILYRIMLTYGYYSVISKYYEYSGFVNQSDITNTILSWCIFILSIPLIINIINNKERISSIIMTMMYFLMFVPNTVLISTTKFSLKYIILSSVYWYLLFAGMNMVNKIPIISNEDDTDEEKSDYSGFISIIGFFSFLIVIYISARYAHFRLNFNLFTVYELRNEARSYNLPKIFQYLFSWTRAINPILLGYCISNRKYFISIVLFITQMLSFGIDGMKSTFFICVLTVIFTLLYNNGTIQKFNRTMVYGFLFLSVLSLLEYTFVGSFNIISIMIRRIMFLPNLINYYYFDYFQVHTPDYFRGSIFEYIGFSSPYDRLGYTIGDVYFSYPNMNANNGMIADAVTNLGNYGFLIMPIVIVGVFYLLDRVSSGIKIKIMIAASMYIAIQLINSFLTTTLLTHGLLVVFIILKILPKNLSDDLESEKNEKENNSGYAIEHNSNGNTDSNSSTHNIAIVSHKDAL